MNIRSWGLLGALLLIGVALSASPAYPAELDLPRVMLKNISYDIPLDASSLDQNTPLNAVTLVADGRVIPLVRNDDQLIFENVRASESPQSFQIMVEATVVGEAEVEVIPCMVFHFAALDRNSCCAPDQERFTRARARFVAGSVGA